MKKKRSEGKGPQPTKGIIPEAEALSRGRGCIQGCKGIVDCLRWLTDAEAISVWGKLRKSALYLSDKEKKR